MHGRLAGCLALFFFFLTAATGRADEMAHWLNRSFNMGRVDLSRWKWPKPLKIEKFYPLGFSADGWFAFSPGPGDDVIEFATGSCPKPPCDRVSLLNMTCGGECYSDTPADDDDTCYCPMDVAAPGLKKFGVKPLKNPSSGVFPARIQGDTFHIDMVFKERAIFSAAMIPGKKQEPMFPATYLFLVSKKLGRQPIGHVDYNHSGIFPGTVRPAGWIRSPHEDRIVVVVAVGRDETGDGYPTAIGFQPFFAHLKTGFLKPDHDSPLNLETRTP